MLNVLIIHSIPSSCRPPPSLYPPAHYLLEATRLRSSGLWRVPNPLPTIQPPANTLLYSCNKRKNVRVSQSENSQPKERCVPDNGEQTNTHRFVPMQHAKLLINAQPVTTSFQGDCHRRTNPPSPPYSIAVWADSADEPLRQENPKTSSRKIHPVCRQMIRYRSPASPTVPRQHLR